MQEEESKMNDKKHVQEVNKEIRERLELLRKNLENTEKTDIKLKKDKEGGD